MGEAYVAKQCNVDWMCVTKKKQYYIFLVTVL